MENHVRTLYRTLSHQGHLTLLHCQSGPSVLDRRLVNNEEEVAEWAKQWNGKGNCYIGRNPRGEDGKVSSISSFSFDFDPVRPVGEAATEEQKASAHKAAHKLITMYPGGTLMDTGNGYQVVYSWKPIKEDVNAFGKKSKLFQSKISGAIAVNGVSIDNIHDPARLIRLAGTINVKGGRPSRILRAAFPSSLSFVVYQRISASETPVGRVNKSGGSVGPLFGKAEASHLLGRLSLYRRDDYNEWVRVGMCLRSLGEEGLAIWKDWSKGSPKYEEGACETKWETFDPAEPGQGLTLGSLAVWADEDSRGFSEFSSAANSHGKKGFSVSSLISSTEDIKWIIEPLIPQQAAVILGGQEGIGKSWMLLDLALAASTGGKWLGFYPIEKRKVLYLDEESSPQLLKRRLKRMITGPMPEEDYLEFRIGSGVNFSEPTWVDTLISELRENPVSLVVVDSLVRSHRGEENSSSEMSKVFANVKHLITSTGVTVLFADHEAKYAMVQTDGEKKEPSTRDLRGSNEKGAFCDSVILAKKAGPQLAIYHTKGRWAETAEPFLVSVRDVGTDKTVVRRD